MQTARGPRAASTAILFLLPAGTLSRWHRVSSGDEVWHLYQGTAVLHVLDETGFREIRLTPEQPQAVVPAGAWQTTRNDGPGDAFFGCTVAPGFDFADFELLEGPELARQWPEHAEAIVAAVAR